MDSSQFYAQLATQFLGMGITVAGLFYAFAKRSGKTESNTEQTELRFKDVINRLDKIDNRLSNIEERAHTTEIAVSELKIFTVGVDGRNGLRGMIRDIDARTRDLEKGD